MRVLLFKGKSTVARLIGWQTRSQYTHAAVLLGDGYVIEAWEGNIFRLVGSYLVPGLMRHTGVRKIALAALLDEHQENWVNVEMREVVLPDEARAEAFLRAQVGKSYDLHSVLRFLSRRDAPADDRWFCSELVCAAAKLGGVDLLRMPCSHTSPRDLAASPLLREV